MKNNESPHSRLLEKLEKRRSEHYYRSLTEIDFVDSSRIIRIDDKEFLNFSSNDYLNLSNHPALKEKSCEFIDRYGTSASSSRLITGTLKIHRIVEEKLASIYQKNRALLFNTGYQANATILPALTEKKDVIIADELCHNSILTGCLASKASFYRFRHNDLNHLETFLKRKSENSSSEIWIATESLFSMDGDRAPLKEIIELGHKYGAKLYVDDAHALGVCGNQGLGYGADYPEIDLLISTFGKAGGSFGAFVASSEIVIEALINYCSGFIYSTALPPAVVGSQDAALDLIPKMKSERQHLQYLANYLHQKLKNKDYQTCEKPSHILPVIFKDEKKLLTKSEEMKQAGLIVIAIRPPTVPREEQRFRISLTVAHQTEDCEKLLSFL